MLEKVKEFCKKHKEEILIIGGMAVAITTGVVLIRKFDKDIKRATDELTLTYAPSYDNSADRAFLESFGATYKEGYEVPFATKEVATKFLEKMGDIYQIDVFHNPDMGCIWINQSVEGVIVKPVE